MKLRSIAFRNIFRNRRRSLLSGTAIAVAAAGIVLLFSFLAGMMDDIRYNQQTYVSGAVRIRHGEYTANERLNPLHLTIREPEGVLDLIAEEPGVGAVSARIRFPSRIYRGEDSYNVEALGLDFSREGGFQDLSGRVLAEGRLPRMGEKEAALGLGLAQKIGLGVGDKVTLLSPTAGRGSNAMTFRVTGLLTFPLYGLDKGVLYAPLDRVQRFLRMPGQVQEILIKGDGTVRAEDLAAGLRKRLAAGAADPVVPAGAENRAAMPPGAEPADQSLEILDWQQIPGSYIFIEMASTVYTIVALFFFVLASTVILNTTIMVIFERMKEIGTMGAMGMGGKTLVRLFFLEAFFIGVMGSGAGVLLGMVFTQILHTTGISFGSAMEGVDFDVSAVVYPRLSLRSTVLVFFYSLGVSSLVVLLPARKVSRIQPVEALRAV